MIKAEEGSSQYKFIKDLDEATDIFKIMLEYTDEDIEKRKKGESLYPTIEIWRGHYRIEIVDFFYFELLDDFTLSVSNGGSLPKSNYEKTLWTIQTQKYGKQYVDALEQHLSLINKKEEEVQELIKPYRKLLEEPEQYKKLLEEFEQ